MTFNAASLSGNTMRKYGVSDTYQGNIQAFAMKYDPLTLYQDLNPFMNSSQGIRTTLNTYWLHLNPLDFHSINTILECFY